jgi:hypothetical protein
VSLIFFLDLFINLFMSPNLFSWVAYLSKSFQDFSRDFSELWPIFHGQKGNSRFSIIIFIRGIKIIPKLRKSEKFSNPTTIYMPAYPSTPWFQKYNPYRESPLVASSILRRISSSTTCVPMNSPTSFFGQTVTSRRQPPPPRGSPRRSLHRGISIAWIQRCFIEFPSHLASLRRGSTMADRSSSKPKIEDDTFTVSPSIVFPPLFIRFNSDLTRSSSVRFVFTSSTC